MPEGLDERDLFVLEAALDALEELHDFEARVHSDNVLVRKCLCREAVAWRGARKVTIAWRQALGLKVRLLDTI